jgi:hypothetical protein
VGDSTCSHDLKRRAESLLVFGANQAVRRAKLGRALCRFGQITKKHEGSRRTLLRIIPPPQKLRVLERAICKFDWGEQAVVLVQVLIMLFRFERSLGTRLCEPTPAGHPPLRTGFASSLSCCIPVNPVRPDSISTLLALLLVCLNRLAALYQIPLPRCDPSGVELVSLGRLKADLTPIAHIRIESDSQASRLRVRGTGARIPTLFRIVVLHLLRPHHKQCYV